MGYPVRDSHFAHRFIRLLTKAAVAQEIGSEACWLLTIIAHQEDAIRYRRGVTFYNEQLKPLCGFGGNSRLSTARRRAVDAGWLHYAEGGKGRPGTYWVLIPRGYQDVEDSPCDESGECLPDSGRETENAFPNQEEKKGMPSQNGMTTGGQPDGKPSSFYPIPIPNKRAPAFVQPTLEQVAAYCRERGNQVDAQRWFDYYCANGWKVGRNPMKDWKAAVRTWERNGFQTANSKPARHTAPDPILEL